MQRNSSVEAYEAYQKARDEADACRQDIARGRAVISGLAEAMARVARDLGTEAMPDDDPYDVTKSGFATGTTTTETCSNIRPR
jgi:hypothetical protein